MVARVGLDPVDGERLVRPDRDREQRAAEEARHRLALRAARHHELRGRALVLVAHAAAEPARADHRAGIPLRVDVVRVGPGLVGRLARTRRGEEEVLVRRQPRDRLRRRERALPLAADLPRDRSAVVVDEAHRDVPVGAGDVDGREAPVALLACELPCGAVNSARLVGTLMLAFLKGRSVRHDPRPRIVRHAVQLAAEAACGREALEPGARVRERARFDVMSWNAPAAMYFVISVLPISMTSGALPPASVASNWVRWFVQSWNWTSTPTPGARAGSRPSQLDDRLPVVLVLRPSAARR